MLLSNVDLCSRHGPPNSSMETTAATLWFQGTNFTVVSTLVPPPNLSPSTLSQTVAAEMGEPSGRKLERRRPRFSEPNRPEAK